jgi:hypothetical protein
MIKEAIGFALFALATNALVAGESCAARAAQKKLAGAAMNSFMKECKTDAKAACEASAKEKTRRCSQYELRDEARG